MLKKEEVEKIARLARIELAEKEVTKFQKELSAILDYVEQLKEVDTKKVEPTAQVTGLKDITRSDEVNYNFLREKMLQNMPAIENNHLKVQPIFEE